MTDQPITIKHLCREFDLDPYTFRQQLRDDNQKPLNRRWKWPDLNTSKLAN